MRTTIQLTDEQLKLLQDNGDILQYGGQVWYRLPQVFKKTDSGFEVYMPWELPDDVRLKLKDHDITPPDIFSEYLGKKCLYRNIECMITGFPQWYVRNFILTPLKTSDDIGGGLGKSVELSMHKFEMEVACA